MSSEAGDIGIWLLESFLQDLVYRQLLKKGRKLWLDDLEIKFPGRYHKQRAANAIAGWVCH